MSNTLKCRLEKLIVLQKKVIRVIEGLNYLDHTNEAFGNFKCLKWLDIIALKTNLGVFKANQNMLPYKVQKIFRSVNQVHMIIILEVKQIEFFFLRNLNLK